MSTNDDTAELLAGVKTLYVARRSESKDHLNQKCPYMTDKYRELSAEKKPPAHVDLCAWCVEHPDDGPEQSTSETSAEACDRCGGPVGAWPRQVGELEICEACYRRYNLGR